MSNMRLVVRSYASCGGDRDVRIDEVLSASFKKADQLSNEKRAPGCSGYIEDYTTQLYNNCKKNMKGIPIDPY